MKFDELPEVHQNLLGNLFDPTSSASLTTLLPPGLASRLLTTILKDSDLFPLLGHEDDLTELLERKYRYKTPPTDGRIRMSFWLEYERALLEADKMKLVNIHSLVCDERSFYRLFTTCPGRCAYLLCRPAKYAAQVEEMLSHGLKRMRQILDLPVYLPNGKMDYKLLAIQQKITTLADMRIHGAPTQKVQQLNLNVEARSKDLGSDTKALVAKGDINAIQSRLLEVEAALGGPEARRKEPLTVEVEVVGGKDAGKTHAATDPADSI